MLICKGLAFGFSVGDSLPPVLRALPSIRSVTPGVFKGVRFRKSAFGAGGLSGPAIFREMNGVLEGK